MKDVSVFVAGDPRFLAAFAERYGGIANQLLAVTAADDFAARVQQAKPDILFIQLDLLFCRLGHELACRARYCIALDAQLTLTPEGETTAPLLRAADALTRAADACLPLQLETDLSAELADAQEQLLHAQLQAGWRQVQQYQDAMQTNDFLSAIALSDSLTELSNRRALEWELPRQIQAARARGMPLSAILLDVDRFKQVNDTHGHLVGDRVLQLLAARLRDRLRLQDTAFRYGGEEFVVLLQQTDVQQAAAIAQRLRRLIGEQPFSVKRSLALDITISLGVAGLQASDDSQGTSLINRADQNLLCAKSGGRNRVVSTLVESRQQEVESLLSSE
ncbi:MAG: diguanylate cyclase [Spirulinaceae cyanobacterium SM2_1_0]|nr:diguanylate cyclase [Spirulinaceae cyanobacterium SM2_1_0]